MMMRRAPTRSPYRPGLPLVKPPRAWEGQPLPAADEDDEIPAEVVARRREATRLIKALDAALIQGGAGLEASLMAVRLLRDHGDDSRLLLSTGARIREIAGRLSYETLRYAEDAAHTARHLREAAAGCPADDVRLVLAGRLDALLQADAEGRRALAWVADHPQRRRPHPATDALFAPAPGCPVPAATMLDPTPEPEPAPAAAPQQVYPGCLHDRRAREMVQLFDAARLRGDRLDAALLALRILTADARHPQVADATSRVGKTMREWAAMLPAIVAEDVEAAAEMRLEMWRCSWDDLAKYTDGPPANARRDLVRYDLECALIRALRQSAAGEAALATWPNSCGPIRETRYRRVRKSMAM